MGVLLVAASLILCHGCKSKENKTIALFEENSDAWFVDGDSKWEFVNNELMGVADSTSGFIITKDRYRNFELSLEFQPDSTINSGVFVQCAKPEMSATDCHELNIWDLHPNQDFRTGGHRDQGKTVRNCGNLECLEHLQGHYRGWNYQSLCERYTYFKYRKRYFVGRAYWTSGHGNGNN